jgi:hypothetical protein
MLLESWLQRRARRLTSRPSRIQIVIQHRATDEHVRWVKDLSRNWARIRVTHDKKAACVTA